MSLPTQGPARAALAETFLPEGAARLVSAVLLVVAGTMLLAIAAKIKVPFFPVPMTLQTLAVLAIAATFGSRLAVITVVAYLAQGLAGLPVFTNTPPAVAGPAYFMGPTGGFLIGFVVMAFIVGKAADLGWGRSFPKMLGAMVAGEVAMMALGFVWLAWFAALSSGGNGLGMATALSAGVTPFLLGDALKILLAAAAVPAVWRLFDGPA
jgi:biotin transport system substrate-specific component